MSRVQTQTASTQGGMSFVSLDLNFKQHKSSKTTVWLFWCFRKISNRESARQSRKRKQEHLAGLETQVKILQATRELDEFFTTYMCFQGVVLTC